MQIIKQNLGNHWVIGLKGNKDDITQYHNRIYNWGGTNGNLQWQSDTFAYFWITLEKLERVMFKYTMNGVTTKLGNKFKGKKDGLKNYVLNRVKNSLDNIPNESFIRTNEVQDFYSLGTISAEKLDTDS